MEKHSLTFKISAARQVKDVFKTTRDHLQECKAITLDQFIEYAQANNSDYNSVEGFNHLRNVYYGRTADYNAILIIKNYEMEWLLKD